MLSSGETNYRSSNNENSNTTAASQAQASSHMSVAAKAGEMQIFSHDIMSQVNGLPRRQTTKQILRQGAKFSSHTNDSRMNHIQKQMNNVEEKMLQIDAQAMPFSSHHQVGGGGTTATQNHRDASLDKKLITMMPQIRQSRDPLQQTQQPGLMSTRDSIAKKMHMQTLQQRLHPTQTFGEYVAINGPSRIGGSTQPSQSIGGSSPRSLQVSIQQQHHAQTENVPKGLGMSAIGPISNSSSMIGHKTVTDAPSYTKVRQPMTQNGENSLQNSPMITCHHVSEKHLHIDIKQAQQQQQIQTNKNRNHQRLDSINADQVFTPTMIRRSIGSQSAAKNERISFLDKAAAASGAPHPQALVSLQDAASSLPPPHQQAKNQQQFQQPNQKLATQQQLLQSRYTHGTEPSMLPKMGGLSLDRKGNISKQAGQNNLPPTGPPMSLVQQNINKRRHGEGHTVGNHNKMDFSISGEALQIKLTGTSLMNRNVQQRDSYSQQVVKEPFSDPLQGAPGQGAVSMQQTIGNYHPKLRARMQEITSGTNYNSTPVNTGARYLSTQQQQQQQQQFAQHVAEVQMSSPRNGNQIFQESQARIYSYHYIYDYLFVHVTESQYEKEYAKRIRTTSFLQHSMIDRDGLSLTPERGGNLEQMLESGGLVSNENSPNPGPRGPQLKLNQNQVFFSTTTGRTNNEDDQATSRFRQSSAEKTDDNKTSDNIQNQQVNTNPTLDSQEPPVTAQKKQVVKMKKNLLRYAIQKALQSTQYEGLKVLTQDSIAQVQRLIKPSGAAATTTTKKGSSSDVNHMQQQPQSPSGGDESKDTANSSEAVSKFMLELGSWLQDQNMRFKVTIKKKYINDILLQSKGAQNLAQNVVIVIANNDTIAMNSPIKKARRVKRNFSVGVSSGDDDHETQQQTTRIDRGDRNEQDSQMRIQSQATPQVTSSKAKQHQIGRRGYESENEAKSLNSTTTSSTFPNFKTRDYATKQQNTPRQPRKMSTRSLSQIPNTVRIQRKVTEEINGSGATAAMGSDDMLNNAAKLNERPVAKIKIWHNPNTYDQHLDHPINKMISDYNEFIRLVFRTRTTEARAVQSIPYAIKLGRRLGMQLTKNQLMPATLKVRENSNAIKEKLVFYVCRILSNENTFEPDAPTYKSIFNKQVSQVSVKKHEQMPENIAAFEANKTQMMHYRCYVGKGNNQMLVRSLFKNRFWWLFHEKEEPEKVNFFWTQLRKLGIMNSLTCKFINPKDKAQQKLLLALRDGNPSQGIGMQIAQNATMLTPNAGSKFKRKKLSSTQSRSPEQSSTLKQQIAAESSSLVASPQGNAATTNIAMTLVGFRENGSGKNSGTEQPGELSEMIPGVTASAAQEPIPTIAPSSVKNGVPGVQPTQQTREEAKKASVKLVETYPVKLANKIEDNYHLCNKKALFVNMKSYYEAINADPFDALPVTFHIKEGLEDPNYQQFKQYYEEHSHETQNIWITKPGECTNCGVGIQVAKDWGELQGIIMDSTRSSKRTCIVQKYIHNPLLINRRKFDIRSFAMATSTNGNYKAFYYQEGYLRTSCREFSLTNLSNRMVHLTNDAVQKKAEDYGKFEPGNKLSYNEFQNYIDKNHGSLNIDFQRDILPQIKKLTTDCFRATWGKMDPYKRINSFECFGLDFMIDEHFKVYLIEVNTNPCLELSSPLLARLIPSMLENALRLAVDPIFPPPVGFSQRKNVVSELCPEMKFDLIFDEKRDGPELNDIFREKDNVIIEIDEEELSDADIERPGAAQD